MARPLGVTFCPPKDIEACRARFCGKLILLKTGSVREKFRAYNLTDFRKGIKRSKVVVSCFRPNIGEDSRMLCDHAFLAGVDVVQFTVWDNSVDLGMSALIIMSTENSQFFFQPFTAESWGAVE